jgi:tetratricopeptide (TPR) repeat protein
MLPLPQIREPRSERAPVPQEGGRSRTDARGEREGEIDLPVPDLPDVESRDERSDRESRMSSDAFPPGGLLGLLEIEPIDFSEIDIAIVPRLVNPQPEVEPADRAPPSEVSKRSAPPPTRAEPAERPATPAAPEPAAESPRQAGAGTERAAAAPAAALPQREETPSAAPGRAEPAAPPAVDGSRTVTVGDEVRLRLGDGGWVYLGEDQGRDGLSFRRRYRDGADTVFIFSADAAGDYVARFQRQDLERGVFRERRLAVDARPKPATGGGRAADTVRTAQMPQLQEGDEEESPEAVPMEEASAADLDEAYALLDEGRLEEALEAFLRSYPPGDPEVHHTIANLASRLGRPETARVHWARNLDAREPYASQARLGLFREALSAGDADAAWEHYAALGEEMTADPERDASSTDAGAVRGGGGPAIAPTAEELLELGTLLMDTDDPARALEPLEAYMEHGASPADPAALYYNLGRLHEERRNARTALGYYRRVVDDYPLSRYWQPAEARVHYLRRHFFEIR